MFNKVSSAAVVIGALKEKLCHTEADLNSYGKCPRISYTKVSDKVAYANSADPDQTAPEGAV